MEHTKGELKIEECFGQTEETPCCYIKIDGIVYFQTLCGNDKANAERLVKCWNYHEDIGFDTHEELINRCAELGGERDIALGEFALIKKQRDVLLAACREIMKLADKGLNLDGINRGIILTKIGNLAEEAVAGEK